MKFIKLPALIAAISGCLIFNSSCKKNLEEHPYSSISSTDVFSSEDGLKKATLGIYQTYTQSWPVTWYRFGASETGEQYSTMGQFGDAFFYLFNQFGSTPTNGTSGELDGIWAQDYQMISRANTVIANAKSAVSDSTIANVYIAEARSLRGWAYFDLARNFGGVPLVTQQITSLGQTSLIYGKRATLAETYTQVTADLSYAVTTLPDKWTGADAGRVSGGIARALLGKVYLTMAGKPLALAGYFQKAVDMLGSVTGGTNEAKYNFGLQGRFQDVFANSNKRNTEILLDFSTFYSSSNTGASIWPFFLGGRGFLNGDEQSQWGMTYKFYQLFDAADTRRDFTCAFKYPMAATADVAQVGDSIIYNPKRMRYIDSTNHQVFASATTNTGITFGKFDRTPRSAGSPPWGYPIDMVQIRFSDVLLSLAEAMIETGDVGDALPLINRVRSRAGAVTYASTDNLEALVRKERRLELIGEFTTVYDIRRWGTLPAEISAMVPSQVQGGFVGTYDAKYELYPIPQTEIDVNPNLVQNPGY